MSDRLATISVKGVRHHVYAQLVNGKPILYTRIYLHGASKEIHLVQNKIPGPSGKNTSIGGGKCS